MEQNVGADWCIATRMTGRSRQLDVPLGEISVVDGGRIGALARTRVFVKPVGCWVSGG